MLLDDTVVVNICGHVCTNLFFIEHDIVSIRTLPTKKVSQVSVNIFAKERLIFGSGAYTF